MKKEIPQDLVTQVRDWLGEDGKQFFAENYENHKTVSPVFPPDKDDSLGIPHPVHFREGMDVRNFIRSTKLCEDWDALDFDDNWVEVVESAIGISQ